jgi:small ligand-binding sensory domain FIST
MTRVGAGLSTLEDAAAAALEAAGAAAASLGDSPVDLALVFLAPPHLAEAPEVAGIVRETLAPGCLLGCVAEGVIGGERELEEGPGVAVWAASLPGAALTPFHATVDVSGEEAEVDGIPELEDPALVLLIVDPFSFPAAGLVEALGALYPGVPVVGGLATGGGRPGLQALILDDLVADGGAVGVSIAGVPVEAVVSQGCAPLGSDAVITRAKGNVIYELAGKPAYERLKEIVAGLSPRERLLAARGLLAGIVIDENKPEYGRGDFLMRGIVGADEESGALAIGEEVRVGQTVRFHARDAGSADEDLERALREALRQAPGEPAGALLFTCNGRGTHMFEAPDHDSRAVATALGSPAVAGFFCGGEIGPVGGRSFLHGFTATMAIFLDDARD